MTAGEIRLRILEDHPKWAMRAIVAIYNRQTEDERNCEDTIHRNSMGFSGADAKFGTSLAKQILEKGWLSPKQTQHARRIASKYSNQLAEIAKAKLELEK